MTDTAELTIVTPQEEEPDIPPEITEEIVRLIPLGDIMPPTDDIRLTINPERVRELADSIISMGQITPMVLRTETPPYEISQGHRRYLALRMAGIPLAKAIIRPLDDQQNYLQRAIENLQREELNIVEEGRAYRRLMDTYRLSIRKLTRRVGRSMTHVQAALRALKMPDWAQTAIMTKQIAWGPLDTLMRIEDPAMRDYYLKYAIENGVTLEVAKTWLANYERTKHQKPPDDDAAQLQAQGSMRPTYLACHNCQNPTDLKTMRTALLCPTCAKYIIDGAPIPQDD